MNKQKHIYLTLFISTFYLSTFTVGGGFVIISLMKKKFVDELMWLEEEEMLNFAAIAQSSPGAVAVNASIIIGYRIAGILGSLIAILGTVLPPLIILSVISIFYTNFRSNDIVNVALKGMQAGVGAVIADVVIGMGWNVIKEKSVMSVLIMVGAFVASYFFNINIMFIILVSGCIGITKVLIISKHKKEDIQL